MLGTTLAALHADPPVGLSDALAVVDGFDDVLAQGFARIGEPEAATLTAFADAFAGTPLAGAVAEAAGKAGTGSGTAEHLAVLAGARSALLGAAHDALLGQLDAALARDRTAGPQEDPVEASGLGAAAAARAWLHEVALVGWAGVDSELLTAADTPVEAALAVPQWRRLAVLLDGFAAELRACVPVSTMPQVPVRRWADLWARGMLLTQGSVPTRTTMRVSGRLLPLGVEVHEHDTAVQILLHAILEPTDGTAPRVVRTAVGAAKTDTVVGPAVWKLFGAHPVLLSVLAQRRSVTVTDLPEQGGDVSWIDDQVEVGEPADPFATARVLLAAATTSAAAALDRHPAVIAEPVLLEGYTVGSDDDGVHLDLGGQRIGVAVDRLPACGPLTLELVTASTACLGLARWDDGGWSVQPLAVRATVRKRAVEAHNGDWADGITDPKAAKAEAKAGDVVAVLRARAGRLLRR
ncbi:hypothetical protein ABT336_19045 [Micromonospora sp. NPDC000207]|uniref:hypothetical protein n=1 Tax=Micromonospora sp. NPDC000207 TaxID=3154246 RepID=UPI00331FFF3B